MDVHSQIDAAQKAAQFIGSKGARAFDRLPALRSLLDKAAGACAAELAGLAATPVTLTVESVETARPVTALDGAEAGGLVATFLAPEWSEPISIAFDRRGVWLLTEALFGGDGGDPPPAPDSECTAAEMRVARSAAEMLAKALDAACEPLPAPGLAFERIEPSSRDMQGKASGLVAQLSLQALLQSVGIAITIPQAALDALRGSLPEAMPETAPRPDPAWSMLLEEQIKRTEVTVRAVLEERLTLGAIATMRVGQILPLQSTPRSRARMECNDQPLFWCEIGQGEGAYIVRIDEAVEKGKGPADALARH